MSVYCGKNLRIEIFGTSHASELGVCISGLPKGLAVNEAALQSFLRRRSPGNDPLCSKRREDDVPIFTQGITDGVTDGTVRAVIKNRDVKRQDYVNAAPAASQERIYNLKGQEMKTGKGFFIKNGMKELRMF